MLVRRLEGVERADRFKRLAGEKAGFSMSFQRDATVRYMQESAGSKYRTKRERERKTRRERGVDDGRSVVGMS